MNFNEIKPFSDANDYRVNVRLVRIPTMIQEYVEDFRLEMNPDFQRGHVWTEEQQIRYIEYLLKDGKSGRDIYFNHPNWNRMNTDEGSMVCLDGLQRITSIRRFLDNQIPAYGCYFHEFEGKPDITLVIHVLDLQSKAEILSWYLGMNGGGTPHSTEELKRIKEMLKIELEQSK